MALFTAVVFPLAALGTGPGQAASLHAAGQAGLTTFYTTLMGPTADGKHVVTIGVNWNTAASTSVELTVTVNAKVGTSTLSGLNGSSYTFTLPASDLSLGAGTASLDTHKHLGKYGRVTAHWTFVTKSETTNCFISATSQHVIASGSASFNLTFPCEGSVSGQISGNNIDATNPGSSQGRGSNSAQGLPSIYFTAASAIKTTKTSDFVVGAYSLSNLGSLLFVTIGSHAAGQNAMGLTDASHFATDKLANGALTNSTGSETLHYQGSLGNAALTWKASGSPFSLSLQGRCLSASLPSAQASSTIAFSSQQAAVSGSAKLTACVSQSATFGAGDTGALISTHKGTAPTTPAVPGAPGATPPAGTGSGTTISTGSFAVSSATPADGATGVPTNTAISVTFNAAPGKVAQIILTEANNPTGVVMLPPPTVNGSTITSTPPTPLQPNTEYKETVVAQGAAGGFVSYTATFTTGS